MQYRSLGRTGLEVSTISFGAWAIGGTWGEVSDADSMKALRRAVEKGVNFFDTADVYGDGHSEKLLGQLKKDVGDTIHIATKAGRRIMPPTKDAFTRANLTSFVERSLKNLGQNTIDLLQIHCPPTEVYYMPEVFGVLDDLTRAGKIRFYGASVERVEEALMAMEYPALQSVQIVFNAFRQRPSEIFFDQAKRRKVGIIVRLPLSSGMLTGKMTRTSKFADDDHRHFNRNGESFDKGETFSGVPYDVGLEAVEELRALVPAGATMAQWALRWILMHDAVTCAIPGAKRPEQVDDNVAAADLPALSDATMSKVREVYARRIRALVHQRW
jgi:aryl-alcohol dehydrogenase-like predicted oxidoreductase